MIYYGAAEANQLCYWSLLHRSHLHCANHPVQDGIVQIRSLSPRAKDVRECTYVDALSQLPPTRKVLALYVVTDWVMTRVARHSSDQWNFSCLTYYTCLYTLYCMPALIKLSTFKYANLHTLHNTCTHVDSLFKVENGSIFDAIWFIRK